MALRLFPRNVYGNTNAKSSGNSVARVLNRFCGGLGTVLQAVVSRIMVGGAFFVVL